MNRIFLFYSCLIILVFFGYSCKSVERIFSGSPKFDIDESELIENVLSKDIIFDNLFFKRVQYDFDFEGQSRSLRGNLFILKDSFIVLSVTPLMGIELFRIVLEPSKVSIIDRINKKVIFTDYSYLKSKYLFDLNFFLFQDIITNSFFTYPYDLPFVESRFNATIVDDFYSLKSKSKSLNQRITTKNKAQQVINIYPDLYKISNTTIIIPEDQIVFKVTYTNLKMFDSNIIFPENIELYGTHLSEGIRINFNFSQLELNSKQSLSPSIPVSYEKVSF